MRAPATGSPASDHADAVQALAEALARLAAEWWQAHGERRPPDQPTPDSETATVAAAPVSKRRG